MNRSSGRVLAAGLVVFLVVVLASEATLYVPGLQNRPGLSVQITTTPGRIQVESTLSSSVAMNFRQTYVLRSTEPSPATIYYYYDEAYPTSWSSVVAWLGLVYHLQVVFAARGMSVTVDMVNAAQLSGVLTNSSTTHSLLLMASGAFPSTVLTNRTDLVLPWIRAGGTLFWVGDLIGYYSGTANGALSTNSPSNPGYPVSNQFIPRSLQGGPGWYFNSTEGSIAVGLNYTAGLHGEDFKLSSLAAEGAEAIGNQAQGFTNAVWIPQGLGAIVDYGTPFYEGTEPPFAVGVANMIQLGVFSGPVVILGYHNVSVTAGQTTSWATTLTYPTAYPPAAGEFCALTYQTDVSGLFGSESCAPLPS